LYNRSKDIILSINCILFTQQSWRNVQYLDFNYSILLSVLYLWAGDKEMDVSSDSLTMVENNGCYLLSAAS
jgi:hypothetical protein